MNKVKGTKIKSKFAFLEEEYGAATLAKVMRSLPLKDRSQLSSLVDLGWYDLALYEQLLDAIVDVVARGDKSILERIGRYGAEDLSQHAYRVYYRSGDPEVVLAKMIPIHSSLNDPAEMELIKHHEGKVSLVVREPRSAFFSCQVGRAFYQRSVELCGVAGVTVEEIRCSARDDPFCEFEIAWD